LSVGIDEIDRVLGGGLVPGSLILLGGDPGIGKSTLILQLALALSKNGEVLYVSGEESGEQVKMRLQRLDGQSGDLKFLGETNVETVVATVDHDKPVLAIVDSVQTMYWTHIPGEAGSVNQVRATTVKLLEASKRNRTAIVIIGHVTKEGFVAGPKTLEHLVDTVLYLEGDQYHAFRVLRCVKNRFGPTNEVGVFEMQDRGLVEVKNPSAVFLAERHEGPGSCVTVIMEGSRPFVVEVQALVNQTVFGVPRRTASGVDFNRLQLLLAVLGKRVGLRLATQDVFVNIVGGLKSSEPGADLAVCLAIASAALGKPVPKDLVAIGEVGLGGEVRTVSLIEQRLKEAGKLGFKNAVVAKSAPSGGARTLAFLVVQAVREAVKEVLG
jgi:DNA repair protein RadA/Sms